MSLADWSDEELDAELADVVESIAHNAVLLAVAQDGLDAQVARTKSVYGDRPRWPGDSEHAVRTIEAVVRRLLETAESLLAILDEYHSEIFRRQHS